VPPTAAPTPNPDPAPATASARASASAPAGRDVGGGFTLREVPLDGLSTGDLARWEALHAAQEGVANPFSAPIWVDAWYRRFVPRAKRHLLLVSHGDQLVGVAPLYEQRLHLARLAVARRLVPVGGGRTSALEIPPLLCAAGHGRAVTRAVVEQALTCDVAWSELSLSREQGWLNAHLAGGPGQPPVFQRHQQVRACVVLRLGDTWDETRSAFRRNVKESVRRARNRLAKDGRPWQILHRTGTDLDAAAVERLLALHGARSRDQQSASLHHDAYAAPADASFVRELLPRLGEAGQASLVELELGGEVVATQLVLHPPGGVYFHSSGFLPGVWELSPITALQVSTMERAITRGDRWANFSPGPNEAKLRWSERLTTFDDFAFGVATHATMARYTAFFLAKDVRQLRHERSWGLASASAAVRARPTRAVVTRP